MLISSGLWCQQFVCSHLLLFEAHSSKKQLHAYSWGVSYRDNCWCFLLSLSKNALSYQIRNAHSLCLNTLSTRVCDLSFPLVRWGECHVSVTAGTPQINGANKRQERSQLFTHQVQSATITTEVKEQDIILKCSSHIGPNFSFIYPVHYGTTVLHEKPALMLTGHSKKESYFHI